jgi:flavin-dependent thymidylate synthase
MKVLLAGYNLDHEIIKKWKEEHPEAQDLTPETISAAYARISRSPEPVDELRAAARSEVEKARQSNKNIVFDMGHGSVAEHAVFNIDIIGVSRLLVEEIEKFRLCSYTEKSQRYVLFKDDFVVPEKIKKAGFEADYVAMVRRQNDLYHELYEKLRPYVFEKHKKLAANPKKKTLLEGWAKEDARYIIPLATETQLGMTANARNIELMLRRLAAHPLEEARKYGERLYAATKEIAPSLIRYTEATDYDRLTRQELRKEISSLLRKRPDAAVGKNANEPVQLIRATPGADKRIIAALIHSSSDIPFMKCLDIADQLNHREKKSLIQTVLRRIKSYDTLLREFEYADLQFEITLSASCFAQLKRHRMATITCQDYDPALGVTIPPAIYETGMDKIFLKMITQTEKIYRKIKKSVPDAAPYILTNAHRKRVSLKINARELYHISRLRTDQHAQWDIRNIAEKMLLQGEKAMPLTCMLATGKDQFSSLYNQLFPQSKIE